MIGPQTEINSSTDLQKRSSISVSDTVFHSSFMLNFLRLPSHCLYCRSMTVSWSASFVCCTRCNIMKKLANLVSPGFSNSTVE